MKTRLIFIVASCLTITSIGISCRKKGCTDRNADNYDSNAKKNATCLYRHLTTIDVSNVSNNNTSGVPWDSDGSPDLKLNFGKNANSGYDFSTDTRSDVNSASLNPESSIQLTNEEWKYQLLDVDLLGNEVIASGSFNPLSAGSSGVIEINNSGIILRFRYNTK